MKHTLLLAAVAALGTAGLASGQIISSSTFEQNGVDGDGNPTFDGYTYGGGPYTYAGANGGNLSTTGELSVGAGVGGSVGQVSTLIIEEPVDGGFGGFFGFGNGTGGFEDGVVLEEATNANDYVLSFDVAVTGVTGDLTVQPEAQFQDGPGSNVFKVDFGDVQVTPGGAFQSFSLTGTGLNEGSLADFGLVNGVNINFNIPDGGNADNGGIYGFDGDNVVIFDNVVLSGPSSVVVPEPASLALLGLGGLGLLRRRK